MPQKRGKEQGVGEWFINPTIDFVHLESRYSNDSASQYLFSYESQHRYFRDRGLLQPFGKLLRSRYQKKAIRSPFMRHISQMARDASRMFKLLRIAISELSDAI